MSEQQPKKPKDIKDLKARLGRTIAPNTQKGAAIPAPAVGPGAVPPPGAGAGLPPPAAGISPPPQSASGGIAAPVLPGSGVAPPPFMKPAAAAAPAVRRPTDPFTAGPAPAAGPQEVRLVIDEKPVDDREVGRAARGRAFIILALGILVGVAVGFGGGTVKFNRDLQSQAIADGKDIYTTVRTAEDVVKQAGNHLRHATDASAATPPTVDFASIEALRTLKKPFDAGAFARKRYGAFNPATVDALFEYYNDVNLLWDKFGTLEARTLNQSARTELANAALSAGTLSTTQYGVLPRRADADSPTLGILVFVDTPPPLPPGSPPLTKATIRERRGGAAAEKTIYTGAAEDNILEHPSDYVMMVNGQASVNVIGQQASAFGEYRRQLLEIKELMDKTTQIQGILDQGLSQIAALGG